jgi:protein-S-isoprenylcysteine O-methyltransferase Ste14
MKIITDILKQISSFILPVTVLVLVPVTIEKTYSVHSYITLIIGLFLILIGLFMMILTISAFIKTGNGTLAPWHPPQKLVTGGLYSTIRNPMITGVLIVLLGESVSASSLNIFYWALIFFVINNIYFVFFEEPALARRFGNEYRLYRNKVPRWIPNLKGLIDW